MEEKIEIVPGDGKINISPAQDNLTERTNKKKPRKEEIVIPKIKQEEDK